MERSTRDPSEAPRRSAIALGLAGTAVAVAAALAMVPGLGGSGLGVSSAEAQGQPCEPQVVDVFTEPFPSQIATADEDDPDVADADGGLDGTVGGERDLALTRTSPQPPLAGNAELLAGGPPGGVQHFTWSNDVTVASEGSITWDGPDGDATSLDPTGLGGVDYSGAGSSGVFSFEIDNFDREDVGASFTLEVYTSASAASTQMIEFVRPVPEGDPLPPGTGVEFPISGFAPLAGAGADFGDVGAIVLRFSTFDAGAGEATALDAAWDSVMAPCASGPPSPPPGGEPDLQLNKKVNKDRVRAGGVVRWTLRARNRGDGDATDVRLCDRLPKGVTLVKKPRGARLNNGRLCWTINRLDAGDAKTRRFKTRIDRDTRPRRLRNVATLRGEGERARDRAATRVRRAPGRERPSPVTG